MLTPLKIFFEIIMITSALSRKFPFVIYSVIYSIYSFPRQDESQRYAAKKHPRRIVGYCLVTSTKMATTETAREKAMVNYRKKLLEHRELDARLKESMYIIVLLS